MNRATVACFVCVFLITFCQCHSNIMSRTNNGYSNDSPFIGDQETIMHTIRVKMGTPLTLKCNHYHKNIIWEYKHCDASYQGILCNMRKDEPSMWKKINVLNRGKVKIEYSSKIHNGIYRCKKKDVVEETFVVEVVGGDYDGLPPSVETLKTSNISNDQFTIQCNVSSIVPPTVIWFKQCHGFQCEIEYDQTCYCHIDIPTLVYNLANMYISKINIYNARHHDSGVYVCLAVTEYGKDYRNVSISVPGSSLRENYNLILFLLVIPLVLIVIPGGIWFCYYCRRKKTLRKNVNPAEQMSALVMFSEKKSSS